MALNGFEKGGGAGGSGARPQAFFGQFRGLFKEFGAKKGGRAPLATPLWIRACEIYLENHYVKLNAIQTTVHKISRSQVSLVVGLHLGKCTFMHRCPQN